MLGGSACCVCGLKVQAGRAVSDPRLFCSSFADADSAAE